ncbi:MAG: hypothetical protein ABSE62_05030 [Chthoniobacteraceae bacterium]|jgi:hypothetical protein
MKARKWYAIFEGEERLTSWGLNKDTVFSAFKRSGRRRQGGIFQLRGKVFVEPEN